MKLQPPDSLCPKNPAGYSSVLIMPSDITSSNINAQGLLKAEAILEMMLSPEFLPGKNRGNATIEKMKRSIRNHR